MTNKYMKKCSTSLIRETQIKITMKYHFTPTGLVIIKRDQRQQWFGEGVEKGNAFTLLGGM